MPSGYPHLFMEHPFVRADPTISNAAGYVRDGASIIGGPPVETSSGLLTRLTFECVGSGSTCLGIATSFDPPIIIQAEDGYFESIPHAITLTMEPQYNYCQIGENFTVDAKVAYMEASLFGSLRSLSIHRS